MRKAQVRSADETPRPGPATVWLSLTDALGMADAALNYYELAPGDSFAFGFHTHEGQEEVFYVESGVVTFRTEDGDVAVGAGEAIRFGPGEYQRGVNEGEDRVTALALGAPQAAGATDIRRHCEACGEATPQEIESSDGGAALVTRCECCGEITQRFD
jgi:uncharacterized cupin superfamily protein